MKELNQSRYINNVDLLTYLIINFLIIGICGIKMYLKKKIYKNPLLVYNKMKEIIDHMINTYQGKGMFMRLG
jgi:hypothetical protein